MTARAIVIGLLGATAVAGITYYNDHIMRQTMFVGNNMPVSVYGGLIAFLLLLNPLLERIRRGWALTGCELAVALALTLAACVVPGSGLMRTFTDSLVLPHRYARTDEGWKSQGIVDHLPKKMLADVEGDEDRALNGFVQGLGVGEQRISFGEIPWRAWGRTLVFWCPLILLLWFGLVGLALVVHRQWAHHEQLSYPVALFADSLLPGEGGTRGGVFTDRLFCGGLAVVLAVHLNNYAAEWFPKLIRLPLSIDLNSLQELFPTFRQGAGAGHLMHPRFYPTVVAFAFFLAGDVSLSLGIGPYCYTFVVGVLAGYGVTAEGGGYLGSNLRAFFTFGAYAGVVVMIVYTGRHHYRNVFAQALRLRRDGEAERYAVWGARVFLLSIMCFVVDLIVLGLDWPLAILYTAITVMLFLVMSRIMAETGLFFIQTYWFPCAIIIGLMGTQALGPTAMLTMMMLTTVLLIDPRESLMPFVTNSLKLVDLRGIRIGTTAVWSSVAIVLGLAVALPLVLYWQYDLGTDMADTWASRSVPRMAFDQAVGAKQRLSSQGLLEQSEAVSGFGRLFAMSPDFSLAGTMLLGVVMVLVFAGCRLRFPRWPLHPVMFLVWGTYPGRCFAGSFLLGWFVKRMVTTYGGETAFRRLKPLMFGLIAGDMLGGIIPSMIGAVYYVLTEELPRRFSILPG